MLLSFVKCWQVNRIGRKWAKAPPSLAIQKRNKALINLWHRNLICIYEQSFLKSLPSSSFVRFLKTWLRPNNGPFIQGDNVAERDLSVYCSVHFYFNFMKKADLSPQPNTWVPPIVQCSIYHREEVNVMYFLLN